MLLTKERSPSPDFSPLAFCEDLAPLPEYKAAGTIQVDFAGLLSEPLQLHEDLASGCGGQLWPAGMVLAKHMLRYQRESLKSARILELGAGGGVVGLSVARGCTDLEHPLILSDMVEMEALMQHNISLNKLDEKAKARVLNWGEPLPQEIVDFKPDVILAADCVYFEPSFPLLMKTLHDLFALTPTATVFFCYKKRRKADNKFFTAARKAFTVTEIKDEDSPVFGKNGIFLCTFTHQK
ncbi:putative methyltransferase-domain-containing protein [Chaetomium sp. MPI-SDFR-AT-0129]|nr:putative methyltransferase-domain-containing protein [Chaetomium sp. MPI-SDFR-AT-0129]